MASSAHIAGRYDEALAYYQEGQVLNQELGMEDNSIAGLGNLGELALDMGDRSRARPLLHEAIARALERSYRPLALYYLAIAARLALADDAAERAAEALGLIKSDPMIDGQTRSLLPALHDVLAARLPPRIFDLALARGAQQSSELLSAQILGP
jgi:tetratricopeptide (TPR) repeat protein